MGAFVPGQVRATSVKYLRILAFDALASTLNTAVSFGTRALDKPEYVIEIMGVTKITDYCYSVPLLMSSVQTMIQIFLELALISTVHVKGFNPTIHTQATIKLICEYAPLPFDVLIVYPHITTHFIPQSHRSSSRTRILPVPGQEIYRPCRYSDAIEVVLFGFSKSSCSAWEMDIRRKFNPKRDLVSISYFSGKLLM